MLAEGIDPDDVTAGLRLWHDHGKLGPNALPSLVHQAMNAPPPPSNVVALRPSEPAQSTADRKVNAGLRLAAKYDAIGEEATP